MAFLTDITLGQYYPGNSFLHRLDPRSKLLASLLFMTCLLLSNNWTLLGLHTGVCLLGIYFSKIPIQIILKNLKPFFWLFLITFAIHGLTTKGTALVDVPLLGLTVTQEGVFHGFSYSFRLALLIIFAALLTLTTEPIELTDSLEKLFAPLNRFKVPVHEFGLMMTLSLRFLPILLREGERIKNAQLSRGISLEGNIIRRVRNIAPMVLPLLVSAIRRAEDLAVAMEARHYVGGGQRTCFQKLEFGKRDVCLALFATTFLLGFVLLSF